MQAQFDALYQRIGYTFKSEALIKMAFTHTSFAKGENKSVEHNQRLEYLGDAVLELCVSEYLYKTYGLMREGDMTRARAMSVCEDSLCAAASKLDLGAFLRLSHGEEHTGGREKPSILADVFEAVTGAIYLDGGMENARRFILDQLEGTIKRAALGIGVEDYKTQLQELIQLQGHGPLKYDIIATSGPDHMREFVAQVSCGGKVLGRGSGKSKKDAQQQAARSALNK